MPIKPKSLGVNRRASRIITTKVIPLDPTFCRKDQKIPEMVLSRKDANVDYGLSVCLFVVADCWFELYRLPHYTSQYRLSCTPIALSVMMIMRLMAFIIIKCNFQTYFYFPIRIIAKKTTGLVHICKTMSHISCSFRTILGLSAKACKV